MSENNSLACYDCGLPYQSLRFADFVVPDDIWRQISPTGDDGGILCAACMIERSSAKGLSTPHARFTSGPFADHQWRKPQAA